MSRTKLPLGVNTSGPIDWQTTDQAFVVNKFGENLASAGNAWEDLWEGGGTYTFPATADITHISQAVDQATMQGETIEVQGLDNSFNLVTQNVTLNASDTTTAVALTTPLRRVFRMKVMSSVVTTQTINLKNVGGGTTYAIITVGNNQTLMGIYTIPNGFSGYMTSYYGDIEQLSTERAAEARLWVADAGRGYAFQLKHSRAISKQAGSLQHFFNPYFRIPEKHDIKMSFYPDTNTAEVHGGFDLLVIKD